MSFILLSHRYAARVDLRKYPSGGSRFETIGNIIYSAVMGCASVVLVVESLQALIQHDTPENQIYHIPAVITVCVSFLAKLALFCYCWAIRNEDSQVRVLWEDHRNGEWTHVGPYISLFRSCYGDIGGFKIDPSAWFGCL